METMILQQVPQLRCYRCGSTEVRTICHHCGRPMCAKHGPVRPNLNWLTENREFTELNLGAWPLDRIEPAHCAEHVHSSPNYRVIMILPGILALLAGIYLLAANGYELVNCILNLPKALPAGPPALAEFLRAARNYAGLPAGLCYTYEIWEGIWPVLQGLVLFGAGLAAILVGSHLNRQNVAAEIAGRQTEVPLAPIPQRIEIRERMHVRIERYDNGESFTRLIGAVQGEVDPDFYFTHLDIQRIQEYRRKYQLQEQVELTFQAGFLALEGRPILQPAQESRPETPHLRQIEVRYQPERSNFYWLEGQINAYPYLTGGRGQLNSRWPINWRYRVPIENQPVAGREPGDGRLEHENWGTCPLRLLPVRPMGRINRIRLQVHFNPADFPTLQPTPSADEAESLNRDQVLLVEVAQIWMDKDRFGIPQSNGLVTNTEKVILGSLQPVYQVEWRGVWAPISKTVMVFELPEITFNRPIPEGANLTGLMRLRVPALRSGIEGLRYFSALGQPVTAREHPGRALHCQGVTTIEVDFNLALTGLPMVELVTLPIQGLEKPGAPSPGRIHELTQTLNLFQRKPAPNYYVRRMVESVPQLSEQSLESGRWLWDISGRYYKDTYPADFHLVIYGSGDAEKGYTRLEGTVQGQVFQENLEAGLESSGSYKNLVEIRNEIQNLTQEAFGKR